MQAGWCGKAACGFTPGLHVYPKARFESPEVVCDTPILGKASCLSISSIDVFRVDALFVCFFFRNIETVNRTGVIHVPYICTLYVHT